MVATRLLLRRFRTEDADDLYKYLATPRTYSFEPGEPLDRAQAGQRAVEEAYDAPPAPAAGHLTTADEQRVARQVEQLRACAGDYRQFSADRVDKWLAWWEANRQRLDLRGPLPRQAYTLVLLDYMGLDPREVPVVYEDDRAIIWRSANFCPTLEACRRLGLDTRIVCCSATEAAVQALVARLDPRLRFSRSYAAGLRPYADYCEEQITLLDGGAIQSQRTVTARERI
ncbi:MAG: GNAT family N-acetyltransferase [Chloroflexi bacterium]|nr:GNAT family N-acetyltransferase [Chloroflexota bacterium]